MEELKYLVGEEHKPYKKLVEVIDKELEELENRGESGGDYEDSLQSGKEILNKKLKEKEDIMKESGVEAYFNKTLRDFLNYIEYFVDPKLYLFALADPEYHIEDDIQELVETVVFDEESEVIDDYILTTTTGYELVDIIENAGSEASKLRNKYKVELSKRVLKRLKDRGLTKAKVKQMAPEVFREFLLEAKTKRGQQVNKESIKQWVESKNKVTPNRLYSKMAEVFGGGKIKVSKKGREVAERLVLEIDKSGLEYKVDSTEVYGLPLYIEVDDIVKIVVWEEIRVFRKIYQSQGLKNVYSQPTYKVTVGSIKDIVGLLTGDL